MRSRCAPQGRTEILITDDSRERTGSAGTRPYNSIRLLASGPDDLSHARRLRRLVPRSPHARVHGIPHIDNTSGIPAILNAIVGKTFSPNQVQPRWIIEGLAVVSESDHSSGGRDAHRACSTCTCAPTCSRTTSRGSIRSRARRVPLAAGQPLVSLRHRASSGWITDVYGPNTMRAVSADYGASLIPWGINRAIRRVTGRTYVEPYEGWKDHLRRLYRAQMAAVDARAPRGRAAHLPRAHGALPAVRLRAAARRTDADEIVYFRDDGRERPVALPRLPRRARARRASAAKRLSRATRLATGVHAGRVTWSSRRSCRGATTTTGTIWPAPARRGGAGRRRALAAPIDAGLRSSAPDVSPTGDRVAFSSTARAPATWRSRGSPGRRGPDRAARSRPERPLRAGLPPSFSPGRQAPRVQRLDRRRPPRHPRGGRRHRQLPTGDPRSRDRHEPRLVARRRDALFHLRSHRHPQRLRLRRLVRRAAPGHERETRGLAPGDQPRWQDACLCWIYLSRPRPSPCRSIRRASSRRRRPGRSPRSRRRAFGGAAQRVPYNPLPTLAPRAITLDYAPGSYGSNALTVSVTGTDIVGRHTIFGELTVQPDAPAPNVLLGYNYGRLPVDLGVRAYHNIFAARRLPLQRPKRRLRRADGRDLLGRQLSDPRRVLAAHPERVVRQRRVQGAAPHRRQARPACAPHHPPAAGAR